MLNTQVGYLTAAVVIFLIIFLGPLAIIAWHDDRAATTTTEGSTMPHVITADADDSGTFYAVSETPGSVLSIDPATRRPFTQDTAAAHVAANPAGVVLVSDNGKPYRALHRRSRRARITRFFTGR